MSPRGRTVLRRVALGVVGLLLLVLIALGILLAWVSSGAGGERVRREVISATQKSLPGKVSIGKLRVSGTTVHLNDVVVRTPEGQVVARVDRVDASLRLGGLLHHHVDVRSLHLVHPQVFLVQDSRGLNLMRAVVPKKVAGAAPEPGSKPYTFEIEDLLVENGVVDFRSTTGGVPRVHLVDVHAEGTLAMGTSRKLPSEASLTLTGRLTAPLASPVALSANVTGSGTRTNATVSLHSGALALEGAARLDSGELTSASLTRLEVPPAWAKAFVPSYPLVVPVTARGQVSRVGASDRVGLRLEADGASASVQATADLAQRAVKSFHLEAEDVNPHALLGHGPEGRLAVKAEGAVRGTSVSSLDGRLHMTVPVGRLEGRPVGPVSLDASARDGTVTLKSVRAAMPGLELTASGRASQSTVHLEGSLTASNARKVSQSLSTWARARKVPLVSGQGSLRFSVDGPTRHPALTANGQFAQLALGGRAVSGLSLRAHLPDLRRPLESNLSLSVDTVDLGGGKKLQGVSVVLVTQGRKLRARARMKGLAHLRVRAGGTVDADGQGLRLTALSLLWPGSRWHLGAPAHVTFRSGAFSTTPLRLFEDGQAIALEGTLRDGRLRAHVALSRVVLGRLPRFLVDRYGLGGTVSLDVVARGVLPNPSMKLSLSWEHGKVEGLSGLALWSEATWSKDRARGRLKASGLSSRFRARFDVPVEGWLHHRRVPVDLQVDSPKVDLAALACAWARVSKRPGMCPHGKAVAAGTVKLSLTVDGTAARPRLSAHAEGSKLRWKDFAADGMDLTTKAEGPLSAPTGTFRLVASRVSTSRAPTARARLTLTGRAERHDLRVSVDAEGTPSPGGAMRPIARVDLRLDGGLHALRTRSDLSALAFRANGVLQPLDLSRWLPKQKAETTAVTGTVRATLEGGGTLGAPTATLDARGDGLKVGKAPVGSATLALRYARARTTFHLSVQDLMVDGTLAQDFSLPTLRKGFDLSHAILDAHLDANDFDLSALNGISTTVRELAGKVTLEGTAKGPLLHPKVRGALTWRDGALWLEGYGRWQEIQLSASATDTRMKLTQLSVHSGNGTLNAHAEGDRRGKQWQVRGGLEATRFPVVYQSQLVATASTRFTLGGKVDPSAAHLDLTIPEAHVELPAAPRKELQRLEVPNDIVLVRNGRPVSGADRRDPRVRADLEALEGRALPPPPPTRAFSHRPIIVTIHAPRNLWVKGEDVNAEVGLSDGFRFEYATRPRLFGTVLIHRASLTVIGRKFDVQPASSIRFTGPVRRPEIDATAQYRNETAQVTVFLTVQGRPRDLSVKVRSEPYLSDAQIYTLLATGRASLAPGSGAAITTEQAASVIGALAASQLEKLIASKLPLDVFTIETGKEGFIGTQLEAGTYLTDRLYLGYTGRIGADPSKGENSNAVKLEYHLAPHLGLQAEYGDAHAGGADLLWSKDY